MKPGHTETAPAAHPVQGVVHQVQTVLASVSPPGKVWARCGSCQQASSLGSGCPTDYWPSKNTQYPRTGTSPAVQWLRLCVPNAGGTGSIPSWGTKVPQAAQHGQIKFLKIKTPKNKQQSAAQCPLYSHRSKKYLPLQPPLHRPQK